jgi:NHLM bacteriocin system ABC transporter peptidase/ATP-binding protein
MTTQSPPVPWPAGPLGAGEDRPVTFPRHRIKVPTVLQMEETECGAASLGMVLAHFGRVVPLEELREACGVSRDGSNASAMLKAARGYGMQAKGYRRPFGKLAEGDLLPQILFWRNAHWVVLEGYGKDSVHINDPAEGRRAVPVAEAQRLYSGIALHAEPGPDFSKGGRRKSWLGDLWARMRPGRLGFILAAIAGLFLVVPGVMLPMFTTVFVNDILNSPSGTNAAALVTAVFVVSLLIGVLTLVQQWFLARLQTRLTVSGSFRLVDHLLHLPVQYFTQRFPGVIVSRLDQVDSITQLLAGPLVTAGVATVGLVIYAAVMIAYSPLLAGLAVIASLLNIAALWYVSRRRDAANQLQLRESSRLTGLGMSMVSTIEAVKTSGAEDSAFERWAGFQARYLLASQDMGRLTNGLSVVPTTLSSFTTVLVLAIGGVAVMSGSLSLGILVGFQALMASFLSPIGQLVSLAQQAQTAQGQLMQVNDVFNTGADEQFTPEAERASTAQGAGSASTTDTVASSPSACLPTARLGGALELRDVEFGYTRVGKPLISGFNLSVAPGSRVALVGASGSGKSTLVKLMLGLYEPWQGEILFDGRPRRAWDRALITTSVSFVDQRIMLFEGTVRDNLTLWDTSVVQDDLITAARDACIHDDIVTRTGGYESAIQGGGRNFSGGQRQRLEIARALVLDPSILILDEATSALDTETEQRIDRNLRRRGATCVIVAHRLSTIRDCDEIIVLDAGQIVQRGTHDELVARGGRYAELVEAE